MTEHRRPAMAHSLFGDLADEPSTTVTPTGAGDKPPPKDDEPEEISLRNYDYVRGPRDRVFSIQFELLEGRGPWPSPKYAYFKDSWWEPREGTIRLEWATGMRITIRGWGLSNLYQRIQQQRVFRVREDGRDAVRERQARLDGAVSWIYSIDVELPEEDRPTP